MLRCQSVFLKCCRLEPLVTPDQLVEQVMAHTGLNAAASRECLTNCDWNLEASVAKVMELKVCHF